MAHVYKRLLHTVACVFGDADYCQIVPESLKKSELALAVRSVLRDQVQRTNPTYRPYTHHNLSEDIF